MPSLVTYDQMLEVVGIALVAGIIFGVMLAASFSIFVGVIAWVVEKFGAWRKSRAARRSATFRLETPRELAL